LGFHQLPLLRQDILLNYYHCCPNCCVCLSSKFLFAQKSFLARVLCFYFYFCKKVKRNIIIWSNNIATNCNLNLARMVTSGTICICYPDHKWWIETIPSNPLKLARFYHYTLKQHLKCSQICTKRCCITHKYATSLTEYFQWSNPRNRGAMP
jgi:hypothetical protein